MFKPRRITPQSPFELGLLAIILLYPIGLLYRLWLRTIRFEEVEENFMSMGLSCEPVIIVLWHNRLFLAGEWQRRFRNNRDCYGLISSSRDGAWLERFYSWSGIKAVRGSSNRNGASAIRLLVKKLKAGHDIGITPDGSRGPRYKAKPGALFVARVSRKPIVLLSFEFSSHFKLKSWDKFKIALPFSKVKVRNKIIRIDEFVNDLSMDDAAKLLTKEINDITFD